MSPKDQCLSGCYEALKEYWKRLWLLELGSSGERVMPTCSMCLVCDKDSFCWNFKGDVSEVLQSSGESDGYIGSICCTSSSYISHYELPFTKDHLYLKPCSVCGGSTIGKVVWKHPELT